MDKLRLCITNNKRIMDSNVMIFTETWLNSNSPDSAIELAGRYTHRVDRTADGSGKTRGRGLCIYINNAWCTNSVTTESHCSPNVEFLMVKCRPYYLPRELTSVIVTAVYTPPDANAKLAMKELHAAISKQQTTHPEAAFIVAGDFNHSNLKTALPRFHQHVSCNTRGDKTLDHVYSNIPGAYRATPLPHIGQSDHLSLFLSPKYSLLIQRVKPTVRTIKVWPMGTDSVLQDRFKHTDCNMFATQATINSHTDIESHASSVMDYISTTIDGVTTQKQITMYPNQRPWMNRNVRLLLKARNTAFRSGDAQAYSTVRADLIKDNDESAYRDEVDRLAAWCEDNNLLLNTTKTKELIVDFRRNAVTHPPIYINGEILTNCITVWYGNCSVADRKAMQRVVKITQHIAGASLPTILP